MKKYYDIRNKNMYRGETIATRNNRGSARPERSQDKSKGDGERGGSKILPEFF